MPDQADQLRNLATSATPPIDFTSSGPALVVVTGGKAEVGATTVALNLAAALVDADLRIVLVDAAQSQAMLKHFGPPGHSERDALSLRPGPAGTQILTPIDPPDRDPRTARSRQQQLFARMQSLQKVTDLFVVDAGTGVTAWTRRFWRLAKLALVITTPDDAAVMSSYATIKLATADTLTELRVVVNQCERHAEAAMVHQRLSSACERFLGRPVAAAPSLPTHVERADDAPRRGPRVWESPDTPFGHAALWLGRMAIDLLADSVAGEVAA